LVTFLWENMGLLERLILVFGQVRRSGNGLSKP
jgi:hypothetical protein